MTTLPSIGIITERVSTHMPLARHDMFLDRFCNLMDVSTHMPLARHDVVMFSLSGLPSSVSTHMPLARHDNSRQW